jgi:alanine racemase
MMEFTDPPLTTVRQPVGAIGLAAVQSLLERSAATRPAHRVPLPPRLVVRGSTGPAR